MLLESQPIPASITKIIGPRLLGIPFVIDLVIFTMPLPEVQITELLGRISEGDRSAEETLLPRVFAELHRIALSRLRNERPAHTLQATALVNEAYIRLCGANEVRYKDRSHFFRIAARLMRRILIDYARGHRAEKRNAGLPADPLDHAISVAPNQSEDALEIDRLLTQLAQFSPRQAQVVEMRFFGGLTEEEIAAALDMNVRTIKRDWLMARAWFHEQLKPAQDRHGPMNGQELKGNSPPQAPLPTRIIKKP